MKRIDNIIISVLFFHENLARKVLPYLKAEYFYDQQERIIFEKAANHLSASNTMPTKDMIAVEIDNIDSIHSDETIKQTLGKLSQVEKVEVEEEWFLKNAEDFCKNKDLINSIRKSITIIEGKSKDAATIDAIPEIIRESLSITFDKRLGHDYIDDAEYRYDFYHKYQKRIPFSLDILNEATNGGIFGKTLNVFIAGVHVGKSNFMCNEAAHKLQTGHNVLYITAEMSEEETAKRIDANLMDLEINQVLELPKETYLKKVELISKKKIGRLVIKEYPSNTFTSTMLRNLLNELKLKKKFVPDVVYIDYLNICRSITYKSASENSYLLVKALSVEMRAVAQQYDIPIFTATQFNREGFGSSDPSMTNTAESFGLPATADLMLAGVSNDKLKSMNQIMMKQLKNRYDDSGKLLRFFVGYERAKAKFYDLEDSQARRTAELTEPPKPVDDDNETSYDDNPLFDKTTFGKEEKKPFKFTGFK